LCRRFIRAGGLVIRIEGGGIKGDHQRRPTRESGRGGGGKRRPMCSGTMGREKLALRRRTSRRGD